MFKLMFKSIFSSYIYVFSFSLINAVFVAYGISDITFFTRLTAWAIIPSLAIVAIFTLFKPYTFILEAFLYIYASIWNTCTISQDVPLQSLLDVPSLYIMMHSGAGEVSTFVDFILDFKLLSILAITWIVPLILWRISRKYTYEWNIQKKFGLLIVTLLLMLLPAHDKGLLFNGLKNRGIKLTNIDRNMRALFYIEYATYIPQALKLGNLEAYTPENVYAMYEGAQNVILIITESSNRNQFSLYGYPRKTTPELEKLDLIVYEDVISPSPVTSQSIPHMLTFSNLVSSEQITTIYDLFQAAGFETYYFDGYRGVDMNDIIHLIGYRAQHHTHLEDKETGIIKYDEKLFEKALDIIKNDPKEKKLLVIQTGVAHFPYTPYYPKTMEEFTGIAPNLYPNAKPEQRNQYDTAIRYIDMLISDFLRNLEDEENTIVLVTSDHGQEVGSYSTTYGHSNSSSYLSCYEVPFYLSCYEVPFYLYSSEDYKRTLSNLVFDTERPYQSDNLLHSIIDLAHIKTDLFNPELSIFNTLYEEQERKVQGKKYEELKESMEKARKQAFEKAK